MRRGLGLALAVTTLGLGLAVASVTPSAEAAPNDFTFFRVPADEFGGPRTAADITTGPDGNLWFLATGEHDDDGVLGRITPAGVVDTFPLGGSGQGQLVTGSDGRLWVTSDALYAARTDGSVVRKGRPWTGTGTATALVSGPGGHLWLLTGNKVKKLDSGGRVLSAFALPHPGNDLTAGPDGNLWATWTEGVDRVTPRGAVTTFVSPGFGTALPDDLRGITTGPDGRLWAASYFTSPVSGGFGGYPRVCKVSVRGRFRCFGGPSGVHVVTAGPDGAVYFNGARREDISGAVDPPALRRQTPRWDSTDFGSPALRDLSALTAGPDGNIWFTQAPNDDGATIGRFELAGAAST